VGFQEEEGVPSDSTMETYFRLKAFIDNPRWKNVPFYLESGKGMKESRIEVKIFFRKTDRCLCPPESEQHHQNILTFRIQPDESISINFWAKRPGLTMDLDAKEFSFSYEEAERAMRLPDAYEKVLFNCIRGDQMLFTSSQEVKAAWGFITPILEKWDKTELYQYETGTNGPQVEFQ
jgi:glucose-6-phosphate 1-dehydrogenase